MRNKLWEVSLSVAISSKALDEEVDGCGIEME